MQVPTITPFDVSTPIRQFGQDAAKAFQGVGDAVDNYNRMELIMNDAAQRKAKQDEIIKLAGLDPARFPETMDKNKIGKMASKLNQVEETFGEIVRSGGVAGASEKRKYQEAAIGADDDQFYRAMGELNKAIAAKKKEAEGAAEGQRLQDVSTGLGPKQEVPSLSGSSDAVASQRMLDMQAGAQGQAAAQSPSTGEITQEGFRKTAVGAGIDVSAAGKERVEFAEKQYRPAKDISMEENRFSRLGLERTRLNLARRKQDFDANKAAVEKEDNALRFIKTQEENLGKENNKFVKVMASEAWMDAEPETKAMVIKAMNEIEWQKDYWKGISGFAAKGMTGAQAIKAMDAKIAGDTTYPPSADSAGNEPPPAPPAATGKQIPAKDQQYADTLTQINPGFTKMSFEEQMRAITQFKRTSGAKTDTGRGVAAPVAGTTPAPKTQAEYDALPSGTVYTDGDGVKKRKK